MFEWLSPQKPKTLGQIGEELAQLEYKRRGYKIVAANFFNKKGLRKGEIDLIACNKENIAFVEVKTRTEKQGWHGTAEEAVNVFKQVKLLKAVKIFLLKHPKYQQFRPQIDVAVIIMENPDELEPVKEENQWKYLLKVSFDKLSKSVTIIPNAVEDWG
jgi:uncharacterized protein (TIGR00252 family)